MREFTKIVQLLQQYDEISKVFEELDTNDDHRISFKEFKRGYELLGDDSSDEDRLREEFDAIDTNDGGQILFDEVRTRGIQFDMILSFVFFLISSFACIWQINAYIELTEISPKTVLSRCCSFFVVFRIRR